MLRQCIDKTSPVTKNFDDIDNSTKEVSLKVVLVDMLPASCLSDKMVEIWFERDVVARQIQNSRTIWIFVLLIWWNLQKDYVKGDQVDDNLALNSPGYHRWAKHHFSNKNKHPLAMRIS